MPAKKRHWYLIIISLLKVIFVFLSSKYYLNTFSFNVFAFYDVEELWEGWDFSTPLAVLRIEHVWKEGWGGGGGRGQHASKVRLRYFLTESRDFLVDVVEGFMLGWCQWCTYSRFLLQTIGHLIKLPSVKTLKIKNKNLKKTHKRKTSIHSYYAKLRILSSGDKDLIFHVIFSRTMESISLKWISHHQQWY